MKKISFLLLLTVLATGFAMAQKPQSVLWEISGKGLKQKSYLLGTIHIVPKEIVNKFPILNQVISKSSAGIFESVRSETTGPVPELEHEPPLDSVFSPADYAVVDSFFIKHGYGTMKDHNNDASIGAMIQIASMVKRTKATDGQDIFDAYLEGPFSKENKPLYGLDDPKIVAEHKKAFWGSPKEQANLLVSVIKGTDSSSVIDKKLHLDLYTASLKNFINEDQSYPTKNGYDILGQKVTERNQLWLPKIENYIAKQSCFIAVGFGHLQYKTGLIAMLKKRGYVLKPINYDDKL